MVLEMVKEQPNRLLFAAHKCYCQLLFLDVTVEDRQVQLGIGMNDVAIKRREVCGLAPACFAGTAEPAHFTQLMPLAVFG